MLGIRISFAQHPSLLEMVFNIDFIASSSPFAEKDPKRVEERIQLENGFIVVIDSSALLKLLGASLEYDPNGGKLVLKGKDGELLDPA